MTPYTSKEHSKESQNSSAIPAVLGIHSMKYSIVKANDEV